LSNSNAGGSFPNGSGMLGGAAKAVAWLQTKAVNPTDNRPGKCLERFFMFVFIIFICVFIVSMLKL